jgi:hypothetical protein
MEVSEQDDGISAAYKEAFNLEAFIAGLAAAVVPE